MKVLSVVILAGAVFAATASAQTQADGSAAASTAGAVSSGASQVGTNANGAAAAGASAAGSQANATGNATVQAVLTKSVDAKKAKQGDAVEAKTTSIAQGEGGIEIPKGSKLLGHVTEAKARGKGEEQSVLGIAFDKAKLKNGQEVPFHALVQAVAMAQAITPTSMNDEPMTSNSPGMGTAGAPAPGTGGGALGGVRNTVGGVTNTAGNTVGQTAGQVGNTVGSAGTSVGTDVSGTLNANSRGVMGLPGVSLSADASNQSNGSVFSSNSKNVKLDSGTQMTLRVVSQ